MTQATIVPGTIWITGLCASGKTSLGRALADALSAHGVNGVVLLDGDEFRARLDRQYGHTIPERFAVLERMVAAAGAENAGGRPVVVAAISHKRAMRLHARQCLPRFMEVHLDCPPDRCASRDSKDLYRRAIAGEYECFPGITEPYEPSIDPPPECELDTARLSTAEALEELLPRALGFLSLPSAANADAAGGRVRVRADDPGCR